MGRYKNNKDTVEMMPTRATKWSKGGSNSNDNSGRGSRSRNIPAVKSGGDCNEQSERMDQYIEENRSFHSSSTDSTRPTVHTKRSSPSYGHSWSTEDKDQTRSPKNYRPGRQRVPGGAAAKLMLRGPKQSQSNEENEHCSENTTTSDDEPADTSEIYNMIDQTKEEFEKGVKKSRFTAHAEMPDQEIEISYVPAPEEETSEGDLLSVGEGERLPYILNRSEAYHESASAAVAALLNPAKFGDTASMISGVSDLHSVHSKHNSPRHKGNVPVASAFQRPQLEDVPTTGSGGSSFGEEFDNIHKCPTTEPLITGATEERLDQMSKRMVDPSKTLSDLLQAIASPEEVTQVDRAYMVRRKNACGALQTLTAHARRRKQICWTVGVLPALTSVLQDAGEEELEVAYPDKRVRVEYEETRKRAIATLMNLSMPVGNRLAVFHTPGLVQALITLINEDKGECLEGCCAVLAYLAKSVENRILMAQVPGLLEAMIRILKPTNSFSPKKKDMYPWMSNDTDVDNASSVSSEESDLSETTIERGFSGAETTDAESFDEEDDGDSTDGGSGASEGSHGSVSSGSTEGRETPIKNISMKAKLKTSNSSQVCSDDADKHVFAARQNIFAMLSHLVKEKDNAYRLARVKDLVPVVVEIATMQESPTHALAVQFLAHLTRHRLNNKVLVFKMKTFVPAVVSATYSDSDIARRNACFAIQNFSHDKSCRQELASSDKLITAICRLTRLSKDSEERLAAISTLKNLSDEPANLIPLSNTPECIATLMQIAHGQEQGVTEMMQFRACDALATISYWLRKIATNGQNIDAARHGGPKPIGMFVPSLKVVGYTQFE